MIHYLKKQEFTEDRIKEMSKQHKKKLRLPGLLMTGSKGHGVKCANVGE